MCFAVLDLGVNPGLKGNANRRMLWPLRQAKNKSLSPPRQLIGEEEGFLFALKEGAEADPLSSGLFIIIQIISFIIIV
uniref:Uncharacterized protein n=1 Tax=Leersia perrieri TaxID=77586 RepID=A0A0D9W9R6_9ORYZ